MISNYNKKLDSVVYKHGVIVICNCNRQDVFSVLVIDEIFSNVIVIDPKVIDNSLLLFYYIYCRKLTKRSGLFACYSNCQ